jgi:cardiolipin synthase (CMP-forming)
MSDLLRSFLPNLLTASRLLVAPYLCVILYRHEYRLALWVLFIAGMTDLVDGSLARILKAPSRFGEVLDPIADKALMGATFLTLAFTGAIEPWLTAVVIGRDLMILLAAAITWLAGHPARRFPPSVWGKLSTFLQVAFVMFRMGQLASIVGPNWAEVLKWAVAAMTTWSGADYVIRYFKREEAR